MGGSASERSSRLIGTHYSAVGVVATGMEGVPSGWSMRRVRRLVSAESRDRAPRVVLLLQEAFRRSDARLPLDDPGLTARRTTHGPADHVFFRRGVDGGGVSLLGNSYRHLDRRFGSVHQARFAWLRLAETPEG